jgi:hypothetical protein
MSLLSVASLEEVKCEITSVKWKYIDKTLMSCRIMNQLINGPDFTVADFESQETVEGFSINNNFQVKFIPKNLAQKLPNLIAFEIYNCSVESVEDHHFQGLSELISLFFVGCGISHNVNGSFKWEEALHVEASL